jgi:hypothetical protein
MTDDEEQRLLDLTLERMNSPETQARALKIRHSAKKLWRRLRLFVETCRAMGESDEQIDARLATIVDPQFTAREIDARGPLAIEDE